MTFQSRLEAANRRVFNRIGYRYIFARLRELGSFNGLGRTPEESVRMASFEDVAAAINIENAIRE